MALTRQPTEGKSQTMCRAERLDLVDCLCCVVSGVCGPWQLILAMSGLPRGLEIEP
jgi:hypothetical protein